MPATEGALRSEGAILVAAALGRELATLRRRACDRLAYLETGEGPENARRELVRWLDSNRPRAVVNAGLAGALSPSLRVGDLIIAREARGPDGERFCLDDSPLMPAARQVRIEGAGVHEAVAITVDEVVCAAARKRELAAAVGAGEIACVDMESAAVASVCAERGVPLLVVRSVSDLLDEDLPVDFNRCRDDEGRVSSRKVIGRALLRPSSLGGLVRLGRRVGLCADNLAAFIMELFRLIEHS